MINFYCITTLFIIFVSVNAFMLTPRDDSPDLHIDENENLVEPKVNFWNIFLKTKARSSFKNILKYLNSFDLRDKYTVNENEAVTDSYNQTTTPLPELKEIKNLNINSKDAKKVDDSIIIQNTGSKEIIAGAGIVDVIEQRDFGRVYLDSENESNDGSESLESSHHIVSASRSKDTSVEENTNTTAHSVTKDKTLDSSDVKDSSESSDHKVQDNSESKESKSSEESDALPRAEPVKDSRIIYSAAGISYRPRLPSSLHNYDTNRRRFVHSFKDGWLF